MPDILVKICGTTSAGDARLAAAAGADYLGVIIDHPPSPRSVSQAQAQAIFEATALPCVAVTVNGTRESLLHLWRTLQPAALQLHGDEPAELVRELIAEGVAVWVVCSGERAAARSRAATALEAGAVALLIDSRHETADGTIYGGTGMVGDWVLARELGASGAGVILAGGLNAENVAEAIAAAQPWMVDVISGVEASKGIKDERKVREFVAAVRKLRHGTKAP